MEVTVTIRLCDAALARLEAMVERLTGGTAAPPFGLPRYRSVWTEERRDVLRELYPKGASASEIRARLEALPGKPLPSSNAIGTYAQRVLGLRRDNPKRFGPRAKTSAPASLAPGRAA